MSTHLVAEANDRAAARRPVKFSICSLLLVLALAAPGYAPAQSNTRKRGTRASNPSARSGGASSRGRVVSSRAGGAAERISARRRRGVRRQVPSHGAAPVHAPRRAEGAGEDVGGRQEWFRSKRAYPFDEIPAGARREAWAARPKPARPVRRSDGAQTELVWTPIGPAPTVTPPLSLSKWGDTSGRINSVAVSPADPRLVLVGASTGGIWRSTDGGQTFAPASDDQVDLAVSWIAFAPSDPTVVYAGMGDIDASYLGSGVLKSVNAGLTWERVSNATLPDGVVARLEVDAANPDRVFVAQYVTINRATNAQAASGVFVSTDGGVNWAKKLAGQARDLVLHPADRQTVYACLVERLLVGGRAGEGGLFRSTDGGETWAKVPVVTAGFRGSLWDFRVALAPSDPRRVYVLYGTIISGEARLLASRDAGTTWEVENNLESVDMTQFGYNTYLAVDPANAETVYLGTRDLYKSTDGGRTFRNLTNNFVPGGARWTYQPRESSLHPDQHAIAFEPGNPSVVYLANDGGLWKSADGGATVRSLNSTLSLVQFVSLAMHPTDATQTVGGTQDNGTQRRLKDAAGAPTARWLDFAGGDGGATFFNPANPATLFGSYFGGLLTRYRVTPSFMIWEKDIGSSAIFGESNLNTRIAFYPPFTGNGVDQTIYFGSWRLFVSRNLGDTWTAPAPSTDLTRGGRDVLTAIAVARSDTNVIYTGSREGRAMVSANGGAAWRDITAGLPNRAVESIAIDPANPSVAYLSVSGYGTGHVFKTADAGASWADVSGNLPNVPTAALLIDTADPRTIYAGTDIGVFRSTSGGNAWETFNNGLPPAMITAFAAQGGRIQVATYGRGAYELTARVVGPASVAFAASGYEGSEGAGRAVVSVARAGDASSPASVEVSTDDDPAEVRCDDTVNNRGAAYARCDYATTIETLSWAAGDARPKTVVVPLIDDANVEGAETVRLRLSNPRGTALAGPDTATLTVRDNDTQPAANPVALTAFFVRQHYLDFLSREPEAGEPWSDVLSKCANQFNRDAAAASARCDRLTVSAAFFNSQEFALKGRYAFGFYKAAFGRLPEYAEIVADMRQLTGSTGPEVIARRAAFPASFTERAEFTQLYSQATNQQYVDALLSKYSLQQVTTEDPADFEGAAQVVLTRQQLVDALNGNTLTRGQVLRAVVQSSEVDAAEFHGAFVAMQYYGYLRRTPEQSGYDAWLRVIRQDPNNVRVMVDGFLNSQEYRLRFGPP